MGFGTWEERLLLNLKQEIPQHYGEYRTREEAYETLKWVTGEDFGYDIEAWERWFSENDLETAFKGVKDNLEKDKKADEIDEADVANLDE